MDMTNSVRVLPNGSSFEFIIANESGNLVYKVSEAAVKINCSVTNSKIESIHCY